MNKDLEGSGLSMNDNPFNNTVKFPKTPYGKV